MSTENPTKINRLLQKTPSGVVLASNWLSQQGYSPELIRNYKNSKWLATFGNGAVKRYNDQVDYLGAVYSLQKQLGLSAHPGAKTALGLLGRAHYLEMNQQVVCLFGNEKEKLPTWFKKYHWEQQVSYYTSSFLPPELGLTEFLHKNFSILVSSPARAMMECLYLMPEEVSLYECYELMEGLNNLVPSQVQQLLEKCTSVKVKRLFLYLAEKSGHEWVKFLDKEKIDLGKGKRSFAKQGVYVPQYQITVSKDLEDNELPEV
ncbi:MAG TPA: type IV toxin-antitoxin system AbiEi family antitoxin domain-containing protein [Lutibacter sp.]